MASAVMNALLLPGNAKLNIAVIGECGSGKSSFINAFHGLDDEDETAAKNIFVVEMKPKPIPYPCPTQPNVTLWELPDIGTPVFQTDTYLQQVNLNDYDFFIILASSQLRCSHLNLAQKIQRMRKQCYFVRAKVDIDLQSAKRNRPSSYNEEKILQEIRDYYWKCLQQKEGLRNPQVFLISNQDFDKYDFHLLQETLLKDLQDLRNKWLALLFALPNCSDEIIQKKKEALKGGIRWIAAASCVGVLVPIPGVSAACNVVVLKANLRMYSKNFGLDRDSVARLSKRSHKPTEELIAAIIKTRLAEEISFAFVISLLAIYASLLASKSYFSLIPVIGVVVNAGISFKASYTVLQSFLEDAAEDAKSVRRKAWECGAPAKESELSSRKFN